MRHSRYLACPLESLIDCELASSGLFPYIPRHGRQSNVSIARVHVDGAPGPGRCRSRPDARTHSCLRRGPLLVPPARWRGRSRRRGPLAAGGPLAAASGTRPAPGPSAAGGGRGPAGRRRAVLLRHQSPLGVGRGRPVVPRRVDPPRPAGDAEADRRGGGARLRAGTGAGPDAPVGVTADLRGELDVLLDLPVHPAAGAAAALVQPGLPVRAGERGDPLHRDRPDRHPHQRSDDPDAGRDPGAGPAPGGLRRRTDPRRHPLGRPGQLEAAGALGIPARDRSLRIVLPQAMRAILPTAFNEIIGLVKGTSIVYVLAHAELFFTVQLIYGRTQQVLPMLLVATVWYVVITSLLSIAQYYIERHYAKGAVRTLPPTPLQRLRAGLTRRRPVPRGAWA